MRQAERLSQAPRFPLRSSRRSEPRRQREALRAHRRWVACAGPHVDPRTAAAKAVEASTERVDGRYVHAPIPGGRSLQRVEREAERLSEPRRGHVRHQCGDGSLNVGVYLLQRFVRPRRRGLVWASLHKVALHGRRQVIAYALQGPVVDALHVEHRAACVERKVQHVGEPGDADPISQSLEMIVVARPEKVFAALSHDFAPCQDGVSGRRFAIAITRASWTRYRASLRRKERPILGTNEVPEQMVERARVLMAEGARHLTCGLVKKNRSRRLGHATRLAKWAHFGPKMGPLKPKYCRHAPSSKKKQKRAVAAPKWAHFGPKVGRVGMSKHRLRPLSARGTPVSCDTRTMSAHQWRILDTATGKAVGYAAGATPGQALANFEHGHYTPLSGQTGQASPPRAPAPSRSTSSAAVEWANDHPFTLFALGAIAWVGIPVLRTIGAEVAARRPKKTGSAENTWLLRRPRE